MRYRSGTMAGYASRLHYITDWALDNSHRGNLREITSSMPKAVYTEKNLDFMSTHADAYPQLADSAQLAGIKAIERNFRHIRIYYIKSADVDTPEVQNALQSGDIVALSTKIKGLDVTHMGIIVKEPGKPAGHSVSNPARLSRAAGFYRASIGMTAALASRTGVSRRLIDPGLRKLGAYAMYLAIASGDPCAVDALDRTCSAVSLRLAGQPAQP